MTSFEEKKKVVRKYVKTEFLLDRIRMNTYRRTIHFIGTGENYIVYGRSFDKKIYILPATTKRRELANRYWACFYRWS